VTIAVGAAGAGKPALLRTVKSPAGLVPVDVTTRTE
jgi:hypothetical protein